MALDFSGLQTEVFARGFDYLNDAGAGLTRVKRWINDAMHEVDETERWVYTLATSTGGYPLTIADLREVADVIALGSIPVPEADPSFLSAVYGDLLATTTGPPLYWYRTTPTTVMAYPQNAAYPLTVRYWKFGPDLSAGTDAPLMPDRFRQVIVEKAVAMAFRDSNDQAAEAQALNEAERILDLMRRSLVPNGLLRAQPQPAAVK